MFRRVFVNGRLFLLWAGQVISQTGDSIYQLCLIWLMLELTGSKEITGAVAMALFLPALIFSLPAGVLADRLPRRAVMIVADFARAALVATIPLALWAGWGTPMFLAGITFLVGTFAATFNPARDALVPDLVPARDLPHANALIQTSWQAAILMGPAAFGVLLMVVPLPVLFFVDAATYVVSLLAIVAIGRLPALAPSGAAARVPSPSPSPTGAATAKPARMAHELAAGVRFVIRDPVMRILVIVTAIDNVILMGPALVGPAIFVRDVLDQGPESYAWLEAALAGGVLTGAPFMAIVGRKWPLGHLVLWGVILDGLTYCPLFFVNSLELAVAVIFVHSFFIPVITVARTTLVQREVPREMQGRMFAVISMCVIGGTAISVALTGFLAEFVPIQTIFLVIGIAAAATALPGFFSAGLKIMNEKRESPGRVMV